MCSSHGEALAIEPLLLENAEESSLKDHSIVALATVTKVIGGGVDLPQSPSCVKLCLMCIPHGRT